jgi:D-alanine-D-alanine ligase
LCLARALNERLRQHQRLERRLALVHPFLKFRFGFGIVHPSATGSHAGFAPVERGTALARKIEQTCKRIYHLLTIDGYGRIDLRLAADGNVYFIEANPNPILAADEDFAQSAQKAGFSFAALIQQILRNGLAAARE